MQKIRVLIVDDSALVRQMLTEMLNADPALEVVGTAADPYAARNKIKRLNPDVLTLDVEMPRMDGLTFLRNLMRLRPMPVVMVSSLTAKGADTTLQALELGAIDYVSKPKLDIVQSLPDYAAEISAKVKVAAKARVGVQKQRRASPRPGPPKLTADAVLAQQTRKRHFKTTGHLIALGASTGGTEALKEVLSEMPADAPGIVITQHMPEAFVESFAQRLDGLSAMTVRAAQDGQQILPGHVYLAPGNHHLLVRQDGAHYVCQLHNGPPVNRHKPSVDVMFRSIAQHVGPNAVAALLTGMGADGAQGLKEMRDAGTHTLAQDEKTSVVWGMPGEAVKLGGVDEVVPLERIARKILALAQR
ncbi:MAG: chemotaxis response regulator protein-glutamate methylesterase [Candidatus Tectomicrobia bacterium]